MQIIKKYILRKNNYLKALKYPPLYNPICSDLIINEMRF